MMATSGLSGQFHWWQIAILIATAQSMVNSDPLKECSEDKYSSSVFQSFGLDSKTSVLWVHTNHSLFLEQSFCYMDNISSLILEFPKPADLDDILKNAGNSRTASIEKMTTSENINVIISIGSWSTYYGYTTGEFHEFGKKLQNISSKMKGIRGISVKVPYPLCWIPEAFDRRGLPFEFLSGFDEFKKLVFPEERQREKVLFGFELAPPFSSDDACYVSEKTFAGRVAERGDFFIVHVNPPPQTFDYSTFFNSVDMFSRAVLTKLKLLTLDKEIILNVGPNEKDIEELETEEQRYIYNTILARFAFKFAANSNIRVACPVVVTDDSTGVIELNFVKNRRILNLNDELLERGLSYEILHTLLTVIASEFTTILVNSPREISDFSAGYLARQNPNHSVDNDGGLNLTARVGYSLDKFILKLSKFNDERKSGNLSTLSVLVQYDYSPGEIQRLQQIVNQLETLNSKYVDMIDGVIVFLTSSICNQQHLEHFLLAQSLAEVEKIKLLFQSSRNVSLVSVACQHNSDMRLLSLPVLGKEGYQLVKNLEGASGSVSYMQHSFQCLNGNNTRTYLQDLREIQKTNKIDQLWIQLICHSGGGSKNCASFNQFYEFVGNWADVFRVTLVIQRAFDVHNYGSSGWFRTYSGQGEIDETKSLRELRVSDFFDKQKEPCVVMTTEKIEKRIPLNTLSTTGIFLNLTTESSLSNISIPELGVLMQMITQRFNSLEVACDFEGGLNKLKEVMETLDDIESHNQDSTKTIIYLNIRRKQTENYQTVNLFDETNSYFQDKTRLVGFHISGRTSADCLKEAEALRRRRHLTDKILVGCEFSLKEGFPRGQPELAELFETLALDYGILDVSPFEFLETEGYTRNEATRPVNFNELVTKGYLEMFYNAFDKIKIFRHEARKLHPNLEIILRFRWPTFEPPSTSRHGKIETGNMLRFWKFVNEFCTSFNFPYFIYQAVDSAVGTENQQYGWWRVLNYSTLSEPSVFVERESDYLGLETPKPLNVLILNPARNPEPQPMSNFILPVVVIVATSVVLMVSAIVILSIRLRRRNAILSREEVQLFLYGFEKGSGGRRPSSGEESVFLGNAYNGDLEIKRDDFIQAASSIVGSGNFGCVFKASMPRLGGTVAVKIPHHSSGPTCDKTELHSNFKMLLSEIKIMSCVREHLNVVKILGAYTKEIRRGVVYIVTEFCENGSLQGYLRRLARELGGDSYLGSVYMYQFYKFSQEIASGMEYIGSKNILHGDLSTRNVLLGVDNVCKISDFGLSRKLKSYEKYMKEGNEPLPWRWMAVESLKSMEFSVKSDVWSYGVTIWEIFSLGDVPYPEMAWNAEFVERLMNGMRMNCPRFANGQMYELLMQCWNLSPGARPTFQEMIPRFQEWRGVEYTKIL